MIISSQHGMIGPPGHVAYATSKGGLINFVHQVAVDFGPRGVLVNAVAPGKIVTGNPEGMRPELLEYSHSRTPFHRLGRPGRRRRCGALPGLRRRPLRERDQPPRRRRLDGVLMRVGFVGVGHLGDTSPRACSAPATPLTVHDRDREAAAGSSPPAQRGRPRRASSPGEATRVITCLPSPAAVTAVVTGRGRPPRRAARPAATWIDTSTNDRHELLRLAALAAEQGVATLEAPVTGGVHKAAAGEITVLVGGDEEAFRAHLRPLRGDRRRRSSTSARSAAPR